MQRTLWCGVHQPRLHLSYWRRCRLSSLEKCPGGRNRFSQRREVQGPRARRTQDTSRKWNLHHRVSKQRIETICWQENSDDMHADKITRWRRSTVEGSGSTHSRRLSTSPKSTFLVVLKHVSSERLTL